MNELIEKALSELDITADYLEAREDKTDPYIIYSETSNTIDNHSDDEWDSRTHYIDVDLITTKPWLKEKYVKLIEEKLKAAGFGIGSHGPDLYEDNVLNKTLEFIYEEDK